MRARVPVKIVVDINGVRIYEEYEERELTPEEMEALVSLVVSEIEENER